MYIMTAVGLLTYVMALNQVHLPERQNLLKLYKKHKKKNQLQNVIKKAQYEINLILYSTKN